MKEENNGLRSLLEQVDEILTDSQHPLDPKQSQKISLMLLQQIVNMQLVMKREMVDNQLEIKNDLLALQGNLTTRRAQLDERISRIEAEVAAIKQVMADYPSLVWLLRYRFSTTSKVIIAILAFLYFLFRFYPALAAWWGLPPLPPTP